MSTDAGKEQVGSLTGGMRAFRTAVLRGLGVVAPPLLTIVILLWIVKTVDYYVLDPVIVGTRNLLAAELADIRTTLERPQPTDDPTVVVSDGQKFKRLESGQYIPLSVYSTVVRYSPGEEPPTTGQEAYRRWVELTYLRPWIVVPVFVVVFVGLMYLLGSLFAAGLGRVFWGWFEQGIGRLPIVRSVYGSAKQVTDYVFSEREVEFTRVVAVEYPCRGVWSLAFVTSAGIAEIQTTTGEPMMAVMVPTSPFPVTGYTILVPKSEVLDVDLSVEQAVEYLVSCGVVIPVEQFGKPLAG